MAYRKRYVKKRPTNLRTGKPSGLSHAKSLVAKAYNYPVSLRQVAAGVARLKGIINSEMKHFDTSVSGSYSSTGAITCLTLFGQGDTLITRNGSSVLMKSLQIRGSVNGGVTNAVTTFRFIIVRDNMQTGTIPAVTDILDNVSVHSFYENVTNIGRFGKLHDQVVMLAQGEKIANHFELNIPLDSHLKFNGTDATQASQGKGSLYLLGISSQASNVPVFDWQSRVSFYDN